MFDSIRVWLERIMKRDQITLSTPLLSLHELESFVEEKCLNCGGLRSTRWRGESLLS